MDCNPSYNARQIEEVCWMPSLREIFHLKDQWPDGRLETLDSASVALMKTVDGQNTSK